MEARTLATITLLAIGLVVLAVTSRPVRSWKLALVVGMGLGYAVVMVVPFLRNYFELELFWSSAWWFSAAAVAAAGAVIVSLPRLIGPVLAR